ncbi:MAG: alginate O-acetyltransferase AlgX-related protein [Pikeienuella sp.]
MQTTFAPLNAAAALTYVGVIATVGLISHTRVDTLPVDASVISGSLQASYEDAFKAANPLQDFAISLSAATKLGLFNQASDGALFGKDGWMFTAEELETSPDFAANMQAAAEQVGDVQTELEKRGVQLLVVAVPDKAEIYQEKLGFDRPSQVQARYAAFLRLLEDNKVDHVNALAALEAAKPVGPVFMRDDTHWSPLGAESVATVIGRHLFRADIVRADVSTVPLNTEIFDGDLLAYAPTGVLRQVVGPAQDHLSRFETTVDAPMGLFGEAPVDVALIGTSFSAKREWHFEGFLKQALQADVLNFSQEGQGPFAPMKAFLEGDLLQTNPPKIVIWEIPVRYVSKEAK